MGNLGFIGNFSYTIDEKNRMNVPAKFRKQIEDASEFVLTLGSEKCILVYPALVWQAQTAALASLDLTNAENRTYVRAVTAYASDSETDKQGRINIPQHLLDYAKIERDVLIVGVLDKLELWNPHLFNEQMHAPLLQLDKIANLIKK